MRPHCSLLWLFAVALSLAACGEADENSDDCADADCTTPPPPICQDGLAISYAAAGTCVSDRCAYEATSVPCAMGCNGDVCAAADGAADGSADGTGDGSAQ